MENEASVKYIGFWSRVCALIIDAIILIPVILLNVPVTKFSFNHRTIIPLIVSNALIYLVDIFFLIKFGGTPGKLILGYRIVNAKGTYLTLKAALIRYLPYLLGSVAIILQQLYAFQYLPSDLMATSFKEVTKDLKAYSGPMMSLRSISDWFIFVDCLVIVFNKKKRAIHDFLADSFVVDKMSIPILKDNYLNPTAPTVEFC